MIDKVKDEDRFNEGEDPAPGDADSRYSAEAEANFDKIAERVKATMAKKK